MELAEVAGLNALATSVVRAAQEMERSGLVDGTAGNVSGIDSSRSWVLITPTGVPYSELTPAHIPIVDPAGNLLWGDYRPSSEIAMHLDIYRNRPEVRGVVHTHSRFATTFAVLNEPIVSVHYVLAFAGSVVQVAPYETYGTPELGASCIGTLAGRNAVLLQNHGVITVGGSIEAALNVASVVEYTAELLWRSRAVGVPTVLSQEEMEKVAKKFTTYGQAQRRDALDRS